jgi:hypothetical protein
MNISWNGLGSFQISAKPGQSDVSLVTNPFSPTGNLKFPRAIEASIVVTSHEGKDTENLEAVVPEHEGKKPFHVEHAGEYEVEGLFVTGVDAPKKDGTPHAVYRFDAEGMRIAFLGALDRQLTTKEIEGLGTIDVLIVPAGGTDVLSATSAAELVAQVEPRVVIASYVGDEGYGDVAALKRELSCAVEEVAKFKFTKATLPEEDMKLIVLSRG